ncbi:nucleoside monophosphate kinase [Candidatus Woesearchaeota archaeon]|nr:nucleoside monophosphate kinase [Candidatus Woesearchaeota archaeon]
MKNNYVILGPPGSGKGTQAELLAEKLGVPHFSPGAIFREIEKQDTDFGRKIKQVIDSGGLVPDESVNEMVIKRLDEPDCEQGFILDGYPRDMIQIEFFEKHKEVKKVILVDVSEEECIRRITARRVCSKCKEEFNTIYIKPKQEGICDKCGAELEHREDDKPEAVKIRFEKFHKDTKPVIEHYEKKGIILRINGEQTVEKVFEEMVGELEKN